MVILIIPIVMLIVFGFAAINEYKAMKESEDIIVKEDSRTERAKNKERLNLLKVAENYPKDHPSRKLLIEQAESWR